MVEETDLVCLNDPPCRHVQTHSIEMAVERVPNQFPRDCIGVDLSGWQLPVAVMYSAQRPDGIHPADVRWPACEDLHG